MDAEKWIPSWETPKNAVQLGYFFKLSFSTKIYARWQ